MKYESYKQFFNGGFFPVDSDHKLVNLENTGEFSVKATLGSGSNTKVVNHYLPSVQGLTNMLNNYTGGSRLESLTSHSNHFIPAIYDANSVAGVQKAIINYYEQRNKPYIIGISISDVTGEYYYTVKATYEDCDVKVDWGDGTIKSAHLKVNDEMSHSYTTDITTKIKIWTNGEGVRLNSEDNYGLFKVSSPVNTNIVAYCGADVYAHFGTTHFNDDEGTELSTIYFNVNSGYVPDIVEGGNVFVYFGDDDKITKFNSGIADFMDLSKYVNVGQFFIYASNLYFDWANLTFTTTVLDILIMPDELTIKTVAEYFSKQTVANKVAINVLKGIGQDTWYQYLVDNYNGVFASISKEE